MRKQFHLYWFSIETGLLTSGKYKYSVEENILTNKYKIVFSGVKDWNKKVKIVRYYNNKPTDKNICLTVRSL